MDNPIIENSKIEDEEEEVTVMDEVPEPEIVAGSTSSPPPIINCEARKLARDAKAKRKDEKTVQQVLKTLNNLKTPEEKLSAMCKKYSELLHENRQLQGTVKQSEKNIIMLHREKEQFRHERSKAVVAKTRMEQLCRELQKLNKAQQEETALKLRVEEEKRKEICFTFQSAFAEMNALTNQNNEKSAKMREENLEMREKIKSVRERIELTETQLDKVKQQAKLELELAREKLVRVTLELTAEKEALMEDKSQLLMKLAKYHVRVKEHEGTEQFLRKQIKIYEEKFEEFKKDVKKTTESLKNFRPESREMKKKMMKLEKETILWKQRWEKTNAAVLQITEIKEKRDAEMVTLNNKLSTLQELCKVFQRERTSLLAQLREKHDTGVSVDRKSQQPLALSCEENRKSLKQVENISKDCEKLKDNLSKLEGSMSKVVREAIKTTVYGEKAAAAFATATAVETSKTNKKVNKKMKKNEARSKNLKKDEKTPEELQLQGSVESKPSGNESSKETTLSIEQIANDQIEKSHSSEDNKIETCAAEIAILERHETVLKDIEKVLAEQAILEAKIACVKEIGKSITDADADYTTSEIISADNKLAETPPAESDCATSEINLIDNKLVETLQAESDYATSEINSADDKPTETPQVESKKLDVEIINDVNIEDNSEVDCQMFKYSEDKTTDDNDSEVSVTEFEIVHNGSCIPDGTTSESELSIAHENEKMINQLELMSIVSTPDTAKFVDSLEKHNQDLTEKEAVYVLNPRVNERANTHSPTNPASSETVAEKIIVA